MNDLHKDPTKSDFSLLQSHDPCNILENSYRIKKTNLEFSFRDK